MVRVIGVDVASFVTPLTINVAEFVRRLSIGDVILSVGGIVSTVNVDVFTEAALPSLSLAPTLIVLLPSGSVVKYEQSYPSVTAVLLIPLVTFVPLISI